MNMRIWGWPIAIGIVSTIGLLAALVGDGWLDAVSWVGLGVPALWSIYGAFSGRRKPQR